jgi:hypothetical protein
VKKCPICKGDLVKPPIEDNDLDLPLCPRCGISILTMSGREGKKGQPREYTIDTRKMPLEGWLSLLAKPPRGARFITRFFPSAAARDEYIATISHRTQEDVMILIYSFLIDSGPAGLIEKRILWVLKLLSDHPDLALQALKAFHMAHIQQLCDDATIYGWSDAEELIRAKFIGSPETYEETINLLFREGPRTFECLVERLYKKMGYKTELTPPRKDGGRDVIALNEKPGHQQRLLVECKLHTEPVGVHLARALLGVVSHEKANKGVLVSTADFTKGSRQLAKENSRLELIDGRQLIPLMNEHLGPRWPLRIDSLVRDADKKSAKK